MSLLFQPGRSSARHLVHENHRRLRWGDFPQRYDSEGQPYEFKRAPALFIQPATSDLGFYYDTFFLTRYDEDGRHEFEMPFHTGNGLDYDFGFRHGFNVGYVLDYSDFKDTLVSLNASAYLHWFSAAYSGSVVRPIPVSVSLSLAFGHMNARQLNDFHGLPENLERSLSPVNAVAHYPSTNETYHYQETSSGDFDGLPTIGAAILNVNDHFYLHQPSSFPDRQYLYVNFEFRYAGLDGKHEVISYDSCTFYFSLYSSNKDSKLIRNTFG